MPKISALADGTALTLTGVELFPFVQSGVTYKGTINQIGLKFGLGGLGTYAIGDLLYASTTTQLARLADVAAGSVFVSGGVGVAPAWSSAPSIVGGPVTITVDPSGSLVRGLHTIQVAGGTGTGVNSLNWIQIAADTSELTGGAGNAIGLFVSHLFGPGDQGGKQAFGVAARRVGAQNPATPNQQDVGAGFGFEGQGNNNGTALTAAGYGYASYSVAALTNSATFWKVLAGHELDIAVDSGSSVESLIGFQITQSAGHATNGSSFNAALLFANGAGTPGWPYGIRFSALPGGGGSTPIKSDGTAIATVGAQTMDSGIDFSSATITTNFLKGPNGFSVTGAAAVKAAATAGYYLGTSIALQQVSTNYTTLWDSVGGGSVQVGDSGVNNTLYNNTTHIFRTRGNAAYASISASGLTLSGSSSGSIVFAVPAAAGSNTITFPAGTTNFSSTGPGAVVQASSGAAFTVATLSAALGGTGIANNAASTITISGNFATTLTVSGATGVTLPTSGTLATLAGAEELTNKTLTTSVGKGTWTASGTWTLPALTLGGTISGGGQQLNNIIIGTSTPLAGIFTTATANSFIPNSATVPTNGMYLSAANSVSFSTNSTVRMTIGSGGQMGIAGATVSDAYLNITGDASNDPLLLTNSTAAGFAQIRIAASARTYQFGVGGASAGLSVANKFFIYKATATAGMQLIFDETTAAFQQTTASTSPTTGSLTTGGGIGVLGDVWASGNLSVSVAAKTLLLKQGANGCVGTFVANGVTPVTVSNTNVAISDSIIISLNTVGGTVGVQPHVATITAATGFTVVCTATDTSTYNYAIVKNAA